MSKKKTGSALPNLWDDSNLRAYLGEIRRRHGIVETLALPSMRDLPPLRIEALFVQPLLAESQVSADSNPDAWPEGKGLLETLQEHPQLVVLGDPGSGKTTLSNWLAWRLSAGLTSPLPSVLENRVPLPCVLREMPSEIFATGASVSDLAESIATRLLGDKADEALKASLRARVETGSYVLILDGVDEIPITHRKVVAEWIKSAHLREACVLATSRIVGYEDWPVDHSNNEISEAIRKLSTRESVLSSSLINVESDITSLYDAHKNRTSNSSLQIKLFESANISPKQLRNLSRVPLAWAQLRYLMPFDQVRIAAFVENWYHQRCGSEQEARQKSGDLLASLAQSDVTRQLARTPNLLGLMAIVHRERAHLPDGKALLYDEIANAYINTIDKQRKIAPGDILARYSWEERRAWLAYVGYQMQQLRDSQPDDMEEKADSGVLADKKDVVIWLAHAMKLAGVEDAQETAELFLGWVARRSGLLLPRGEGRYAFVHLSFQEYFCACYLHGRIVSPAFIRNDPKSDAPQIRTDLAKWCKFAVWRETLIYLFELLSAKQGGDWVDDLAEVLFPQEESNVDFKKNRAALAARLIADRHIRLGLMWKDRLADSCVREAWFEAKLGDSKEQINIFSALIEADYAAIVGTPSQELSETTDSPILHLKHIALQDVITHPKLRICILREPDIDNLSPLLELKNLKILSIEDNTQATDITPLGKLSELRMLHLGTAQVTDITPLSTLTHLESLYISGTKISDISPLSNLINLETLFLSGSKIKDIRPLSSLKALEILFLPVTKIKNLSPLAHLSKLTTLDIRNTQVTDIAPLAALKNLCSLNLSQTQVTDVTPLASLDNLLSLDISNTAISEISSLSALHALKIIGAPSPKKKGASRKKRKATPTKE